MIWPLIIISLILFIGTQFLRRILRPRVIEYDTTDADVSSSSCLSVSFLFTLECNAIFVVLWLIQKRAFIHCRQPLRAIIISGFEKYFYKIIFFHVKFKVRGNLPSCSICVSCEEMCGDGVGLIDYRCALCQATVHADCKYSVGERCNLGVNRDFIIPPNCVTVRRAGNRRYKQLVIESITLPNFTTASSWRPIFVLVNPRSGGAEGFAILQTFRRYLHPVQVINVDSVSVYTAFRWIEVNPKINCYVLVAGGDGTVSLVLDAIGNLHRKPPVAILPLGTGNDLSRVLGWGSAHSGSIDFSKICSELRNSSVTALDRWSVTVIHRRRLGVRPKNKRLSMVNYISIGVDACVTYGRLLLFFKILFFVNVDDNNVYSGMQSTRSSIPRLFSSRLLNKLLFFTYGTKDVLEHACADLEQKVELTVDGVVVELPPLEGITILNIPYWGAGVRPWPDLPHMPQAISDKKLEVFGVRSSFHIAQMQVGVSKCVPLAQGSELKIRLFDSDSAIPMQCDGEAWIQHAGNSIRNDSSGNDGDSSSKSSFYL
ncbi:unnamed protein product [Anisakis simplex]|uniref:Diacylglycerol kinase n=1 Tax=Anisakis simplex TaxID=6269 RepID=A0A0M3JVT5_ANISI|nr:unnamed protein product [Anisakis simplex]